MNTYVNIPDGHIVGTCKQQAFLHQQQMNWKHRNKSIICNQKTATITHT